MKIRYVETQNFGSYLEFKMDFDQIDLALLYGATGTGKSTVMDMVSWCLYGITAKGLAADEVRSWHSKEPTSGTVVVDLGDRTIGITRIRGNRSHDNDVFIMENDNQVRGKDATETQTLINARLGADADEFVTASYFHEFSESANFFIAKAKDRRSLFEKLAPLDFPKNLAEKSAQAKKTAKAKQQEKAMLWSQENGKLKQLIETRDSTIRASDNWERGHAKTMVEIENLGKNYEVDRKRRREVLQDRYNNFETEKAQQLEKYNAKLNALQDAIAKFEPVTIKESKKENVCKSCNQIIGHKHDEMLEAKEKLRKHTHNIEAQAEVLGDITRVTNMVNSYGDQIKTFDEQGNPYLKQLETERNRKNPFRHQIDGILESIVLADAEVAKLLAEQKALEAKISDLSQLYDLSSVLRAELLKRTVGEINDNVNQILETYFDSELKVSLLLDEDNLEARIEKSGFECNYRQLSKGQRQLLRLSFVLSIQRALSNKLGVWFQNLFFDEALDGLDEELKIKAYALFESLSLKHESILIIDHSKAFHNLFTKRFCVTMKADRSEIEEENE